MENKKPLEVLHRLSLAIARAANLEEIYQLILDEAVDAVGVDRASIMKFDSEDKVLKVVAAKGLKKEIWNQIEVAIGEGVSGRVFAKGEPLLIKKLSDKNLKGKGDYKTFSLITAPVTAFPMQIGKTPMGVINMTDKKDGSPFTDEDLKLLITIANQVAAYLHVTDLSKRLQEAEKAKQQLEIARMIQEKLLPKNPPKSKGADLAGMLISAERVGGDYYDFLPGKGKDDVCLAIADVSGHNVGGAMLASSFRTCLKTENLKKESPAMLVEAINQILFDDLFQSEQFISMFYLEYRSAKKEIIYTNAGHNPPLLWRSKKKESEWLFTQDSLLGIESTYSYHEKKKTVEKGDILILYTDGLTEAFGKDSTPFGTAHLEKIVSRLVKETAQKILDSILKEWKSLTNGQGPKDDVTLVVMKIA